MANQTLKAFYYGNLTPCDKQMVCGSEAARVMAELSDAEAELSQSLQPELQPVLDQLIAAVEIQPSAGLCEWQGPQHSAAA